MAQEPSAETLEKLQKIFKEHEGNRGHLLIVLQKIQAIYGYVPPFTFEMVAQALGATKSEIYGVLTFYNRFHLAPRGKHTIALPGNGPPFRRSSIIETIKAQLKLPPARKLPEDFSLEEGPVWSFDLSGDGSTRNLRNLTARASEVSPA
jgi:NADH:ubiquinone oxidoreductase subunit E